MKNNKIDKHVAAERQELCRGCEQYLPNTGQCGVCKCFISIKTLMKDEQCAHPKKKLWEAVK